MAKAGILQPYMFWYNQSLLSFGINFQIHLAVLASLVSIHLISHLSTHPSHHPHSHHPSLLRSFAPGFKPTFSTNQVTCVVARDESSPSQHRRVHRQYLAHVVTPRGRERCSLQVEPDSSRQECFKPLLFNRPFQ